MNSSPSTSRTIMILLKAGSRASWLKILACGLLAGLLVLNPIGWAAAQTIPDAAPAIVPEPVIQSVLSHVDTGKVSAYAGDLSGAWPVNIGGNTFQFVNRYSLNPISMDRATQYAYERLVGFGLDVSYQEYPFFNTTLRNVIAEQPGRVHPEQIYLITAHLDSINTGVNGSYTNPDAPAPGADDNASGSTGVLIAAELLSQFDFDYTLRYVLFTGEERGLGGSYAYAYDSYLKQEDILGVLNLDMIAYNSVVKPDPYLDLHTRYNDPGDLAIASLFAAAVDAYELDLLPEIFNDNMGRSDHASFWQFGYPAILAIEDDDDFTPYYHSAGDQLSTLNLDYFAEFVRAAVASLAHLGGLLGYAEGVVRDAPSSQPLADAIITVQYDATRLLAATSQPTGAFSLPLPPGSFTVNATAPNHVPLAVPGVDILAGQATNLDLALGTCQHLEGVSFSFAPAEPIVGQTVSLTASLTAAVPNPVDYTWDFGDGSPVVSGPELTSVSHVFTLLPQDQAYQVRVKAFNNCYIPVELIRAVQVLAYKQFLPVANSASSSSGLAQFQFP